MTAPALVMSLEKGRTLLRTLDSLSALSDTLKRQVALRDSLLRVRQRKLELCQGRLSWVKDTVLQQERSLQESQREVIEALKQNQTSVWDEIFGEAQSFTFGFAGGATTCALLR